MKLQSNDETEKTEMSHLDNTFIVASTRKFPQTYPYLNYFPDKTRIRFDSIDGEAFYTDSDEIAYIEKGKKPLLHESFADPAEFVPAYYVQLKHRNTPVEVSQEDYTWLTRKLYPEVIKEEQHDNNV